MIKKECFTTEWIEQVSSELHYNDKNLIEKVIRALYLLEMLVKAGCPLVFKGGISVSFHLFAQNLFGLVYVPIYIDTKLN